MNTRMNETNASDRGSMILGTAAMLAWTFGIGVAGFVLLLAAAYGLLTQAYTLTIICLAVLLTPLMMTLVWGVMKLVEALKKELLPKAFVDRTGGSTAYAVRRTVL